MKKTIFTILIILLAVTSCLNFVSAENETKTMLVESEEESKSRIDEEVKSRETGHVNITFDDDYNGYCISYGKHEATEGDSFSVKNTSYAVNNNNGADIGNYLKIYFVDYYEHTLKDEIVTQHTIWHFTDDFNGWRLDYDLIESIKNAALTKTVPDHGAVKQINDTTEAVFDFEVLYSGKSEYQNFFGYKVTYRDIVEASENNQPDMLKNPLLNNSNENNISDNEKSESNNLTNESNTSDNKSESNNITDITASQNSTTPIANMNQSEEDENSTGNIDNPEKRVKLSKHITGQKRNIGILMLLIVLAIIAVKYIRRD